MGRAQRNPSSRDPDPAAQSDGFCLWLYPSYGLASARRMGRAQRNPSSRDPGPAAKAMGFAFGSTHPTDWHQARRNSLSVLTRSTRRSEEHTSELQSLMRISYAVFCLKKKNNVTIYIPLSVHILILITDQ